MKMLVALVVLVVAALLVLGSRSATAQKPSGDTQVIAQLKAAGSNLALPHPMEFFLYFPSQAAAERASEQISAHGFGVKVSPPAQGGEQWVVLATKNVIPLEETLLDIRRDFSAIATAEGGDYDCWGSGVVR